MSSILKRPITSTRLGDLLVQAGILTQMQLGEAMRAAQGKKMQIGQMLVMNGLISPRDLQSALEAQSMLRDKSVELTEALRCLKIAYKVGAPFRDILFEYATPKRTQSSKLGELLVESGLVTYEVLAKAVEQSNTTGLPLGRMLVLHQIISNEVLNAVLDMQVRVRDEMMTRAEAIASLRAMAGLAPIAEDEKATPPPAKPEAPRKKGLRLGELMVMAGVLTETDVMNALEWGLVNQQTIGQVLISQMLVSQSILDAALELQKLVDKGELNSTRASECLARVHGGGATLEDAVKDVREEQQISGDITFDELLSLANVLTEDELDDAFDISTKSAAVIGKFLVLTGHLDVPTLQAALRCYQLISKGLIGRDDAVVTLDYCLHQSPEGPIKFDDALKELGWSKERGLRLKGERTIEQKVEEAAREQAAEAAAANAGAGADADASTATPPAESVAAEALAKAESGVTAAAEAVAAVADGAGASAIVDVDAAAAAVAAELAAEVTSTIDLAPPPEADAGQMKMPSIADDSLVEMSTADDASPEALAETEALAAMPGTAEAGAAPLIATDEAPKKPRKHNQTIQPSDARASRLASLVKGQGSAEDLMKGFDPSSDPPSALHRVFERLAHSYFRQGNFPQAQVIYERVLVHRLNQVGPQDPALVADLSNLAGTLLAQDKHDQAEPFVRRAVAIAEQSGKFEPLKMAELYSILSNIYMKQERLPESESLIRRSFELRKSVLAGDDPDLAQTLSDYAKLLRKMQRPQEAEEMYKQSLSILSRLEQASMDEEDEQTAKEVVGT